MMNWCRWILQTLIRSYQIALSPLLPPRCRYYPTCSHYALEAIQLHGARTGSYLALRRVLRCHPWGGSGVDWVPGSLQHSPRFYLIAQPPYTTALIYRPSFLCQLEKHLCKNG